MNDLHLLLSGTVGEPLTPGVVLLSLLLAFALTQAVGAVYMWTFRAMSYSRAYVQALGLGGVIAAMVMLSINNSVAAGLGIAGSLAIIRFRTAMRDPRDMVFVFASMGAGIAAGLRAYEVAVFGTALFCVAALLLDWADFGSRHRFDGLLRLVSPADGDEGSMEKALGRHTSRYVLVGLREAAQGEAVERAYHVRLADPRQRTDLLRALEDLPGIRDVSLTLQEHTVEI